MSTNINRATFDFSKIKDFDRKEDRYDENVKALLEENGLYRKKLPKGSDSLMRAVSDTLYFSSNHSEEIQQSILKRLTQMIASNKLTPRLNTFQGSSMMLNDYANNPNLPGFEKTNLELISLTFNVRVILYTMSEDHYLSATIFNNNYQNTIELLRTKTSHYDAIFPQSFIDKAGMCQNIVLNLIDKAINGSKTNNQKDLNGDQYVNVTYESSLVVATTPNKDNNEFRITRGHHKKSLSDNFNTNFEFMEEQQLKFYDAFMNAAPPDDFLKNLRNRKDTAESGFSINANFDFMDEQNLDVPFKASKEFAIKNYPIKTNGLSPRASDPELELDSPMPAFSKTKFSNHPNVLFGENLSLAEIERLEKTVNTATTQESQQPFYRNVSPPGLSPTKFSQRSFTDAIQTPTSDFLGQSPSIPRETHTPTYHYGSASPAKRNISPFSQNYSAEQALFASQPMNNQRHYAEPNIQPFAPQAQQSQTFTLQPQQFNSMYMKRQASVGNSVTMPHMSNQVEEFSPAMGYDQGMGYDQMGFDQNGYEGMDFDPMMYGPGFNGQREKRKPVILDESKERYNGRLKFFDENKKYGFIVMDDDGSDIFVHYDDLVKANITKDLLRTARLGNVIRLNFSCMAYIGKYNRSRKAIDIQMLV